MLNFIKKLFSKQEIPEEKIELNELNDWLVKKSSPIIENLRTSINQIISKINDEKQRVSENLRKLESAKLQNPKIPERAITIMEGNRTGFIRKVIYFFDNMDLVKDDRDDILEKCNNIKNDIEILGKGTMKSYQVLNEFFAREAENVAINIKKVEKLSKTIIDLINDSKVMNVNKIKNEIMDIQNKIKLKEEYSKELDNNQNELQNIKNKKIEIEKNINGIKLSSNFRDYEKLLEERDNAKSKLNNIESQLFHDFSVLEKALKKYAKIAFENEKLIVEYLGNPIITLIKDNDLKIVNILDSLKNAITRNEFDMDQRKKDKTIVKINEVDGVYFAKIKDDFQNAKKSLNDLKTEIENNISKKDLDTLNIELKNINQNVENLSNNISNKSSELTKINLEKLKENLASEIYNIVNVKITIH